MAINHAALKAELTTDPRGYGYAAAWASGNDSVLCDLLNQVRAGISIPADTIQGADVLDAIAAADLVGLTQLQLTALQIVTSASGGVRVKSPTVRAILTNLFATASAGTKQALLALQNRPGSRAEELFGAGTALAWDDVARARRA